MVASLSARSSYVMSRTPHHASPSRGVPSRAHLATGRLHAAREQFRIVLDVHRADNIGQVK
jgi:hypothetical protein